MERLWQAMDAPVINRPTVSSAVMPFVVGTFAVAAGGVVRLALDPVLGDRAVFLFFVPAVLIGAVTGGWLPGSATTLLSLATGFAVFGRYGRMTANQVDAVVFGLLGIALAVGGDRLRRSQARSADLARHVTERQEHLQSILDTVPDPMVVIDEGGLIESFSPAAERLFKWSQGEVVGENVSILMPSPDREAHDAFMQRYAATGERRIIGATRVVIGRRKNGSHFSAELSIAESRLGSRRFFTGFFQDLTEREAAAARVQTLQSELLQISRLSAMGEMASALAHELNQPLSAISNYLRGGERLLRNSDPHSPALAAMDKAATQALRAGDIIRRLRDFVVRGESDRKMESLRQLTEEASALGLIGVKELGVSTYFKADPGVDEVFVDKVQIQQVVINLMRNAIDAMRESARRELRVTLSVASENMALLSVTDSGPGISPQVAGRLFHPFVTTKGTQGMGVGLSICRTIIEAHGGRIWAEPNPDGGAIFRFTVPTGSPRGGR
ncbi:MAG TPA: PAS domain S-box protein [Caulobacteraceae bacterium]|jgi:two-component system sensor kinase FixL|nr:PAS domain S-box protein [Caulobacteraceae bacterium]